MYFAFFFFLDRCLCKACHSFRFLAQCARGGAGAMARIGAGAMIGEMAWVGTRGRIGERTLIGVRVRI